MATTKGKRTQQPVRKPEKKYGPYHNGIGIAIWLNSVETEQGIQWFRSITFAARRYRDAKDGQWKDAKSFRPVDLGTLALALEAAQQYCASVPLPGMPLEGDEMEDLHHDNGSAPVPPPA